VRGTSRTLLVVNGRARGQVPRPTAGKPDV